ncbi:hypothetical protein AB0P21_19535 [Kribbella sp. NPDC056861]|uniref:CAP domain-containing protein n=1 Tax=Kribbella sp. NPDC056861 TaxID=3154857 RepID=UPI00343BDE96
MSPRPAAGRRRRSTRAPRPQSRVRRTAVAIGTVILVITPISWILLHQPQSNQAEASVPYVTRDDDTYLQTSTTPIVATPTATIPGSTPTPAPTTGTPKPTATPSVPGRNPTTTPTDAPTAAPTDGSTDQPTSGPTDSPDATQAPQNPASQTPGGQTPEPTHSPSSTPSSTPSTTTPPPPSDDGSMSGAEVELFTLVDNARAERGCAPLQRDSDLTGGARQDAKTRAKSGDVSDNSSSMAATGGDDVTAKAAFTKLKSASAGTLFNCGLHELGVGKGTSDRKVGLLCPLVACTTKTRVAWVVDFR